MGVARLCVILVGCLGHFPCNTTIAGAGNLPLQSLAREIADILQRVLNVLTRTKLTGLRVLHPEAIPVETGDDDVSHVPRVARACYAHALLIAKPGSPHNVCTRIAHGNDTRSFVY